MAPASNGNKTAMFSSASSDAPIAVSPSLLADGSRAFVLDYADGTSIVAKVKDDNTLSLEKPDGTSVDASFAFQTNADQSITVVAVVGQVATAVNVASDSPSGTATSQAVRVAEAKINWGAVGNEALKGLVAGGIGGAVGGAVVGAMAGGIGAGPGALTGGVGGAVTGAITGAINSIWDQMTKSGQKT